MADFNFTGIEKEEGGGFNFSGLTKSKSDESSFNFTGLKKVPDPALSSTQFSFQSIKLTGINKGLGFIKGPAEFKLPPTGFQRFKRFTVNTTAEIASNFIEGFTLSNIEATSIPFIGKRTVPEAAKKIPQSVKGIDQKAQELIGGISQFGGELAAIITIDKLIVAGGAHLLPRLASTPVVAPILTGIPKLIKGELTKRIIKSGIRGTLLGSIIGALENPPPGRSRAEQALITGLAFGAFSSIIPFAQTKLSEAQFRRLDALFKTAEDVKNADSSIQALRELPISRRIAVTNVLKAEQGIPVKLPRTQTQWIMGIFGIDDTAFETVVKWVDRLPISRDVKDMIGDRLIYGYSLRNAPGALEAFEKRMINIGLGTQRSIEMAEKATRGLTPGEQELVFRQLQRDLRIVGDRKLPSSGLSLTELDAITAEIRAEIDALSRELAKLNIPLETKDTIINNIGTYLHRVYQRPEVKGVFKNLFFKGKAKKLDLTLLKERGRLVRVAYEKAFRGERLSKAEQIVLDETGIRVIGKTLKEVEIGLNNITINNIRGIGPQTSARLKSNGLGTVEAISEADIERIARQITQDIRLDLAQASIQNSLGRRINVLQGEVKALQETINQASRPRVGGVQAGVRRGRSLERAQNITKLNERLAKKIQKLNEATQKLESARLGKQLSFNESRSLLAEDVKFQAEAMATERVRLINRRNEVNNLIDKPPKVLDFSLETRQEIGQVFKPGIPIAKSVNKMVYDIETNRLYNFIVSNPEWIQKLPRGAKVPGFQLLEGPRWGNLNGLHVRDDIANELIASNELFAISEELVQKAISLWKFGKVALNPATQARNIMFNSILLDLAGTAPHKQPRLISAAIDILGNPKSPLHKEFLESGLLQGTFSHAEMSQFFRGMKLNPNKNPIMHIFEAAGEGVGRTAGKFYQSAEQVYKIARALDLMEQGIPIRQAALDAEKWLFNYQKVTPFIDNLRKFRLQIGAANKGPTLPLGIPFVTFHAKVMPRLAEAMV